MSRGRKPNILKNDIKEQIQEHWYGKDDYDTWPLWIDDIVSGVARLDWYGDRPNQLPLSTVSIIRCFIFLEEISTETVMQLLEVKKSQAKLYVKACSLSYVFLKRSLEDENILKMRYPRWSIASEAHGMKLGYNRQNRALI
mgnify:CR=1 FL=1